MILGENRRNWGRNGDKFVKITEISEHFHADGFQREIKSKNNHHGLRRADKKSSFCLRLFIEHLTCDVMLWFFTSTRIIPEVYTEMTNLIYIHYDYNSKFTFLSSTYK